MYQVQLTVSVEGHQTMCYQGLCCVGHHSSRSNPNRNKENGWHAVWQRSIKWKKQVFSRVRK